MARSCVICDKKPVTANNVSHARNRTKTRNKPNLQPVKILLNGRVRRALVCSRCLRSGKVKKVA